MSDFDLLLRSAQDIGICDGKIAALGQNLPGSAQSEIDATTLEIFPGVIDAHVHFNEPGRTDWEGFATGSRAAAAGGATTVFDMPLNAHPPTIDGPSFDAKRRAAEANSLVDFALWGGLVPGNLEQLAELRERGVIGLKAFMCNSGIDDFLAVDSATLRAGMKRAAELDLLVAVHAESEEMTRRLTNEKIAAGKTSVSDFLAARPVEAELDAIRCALDLGAETGCRLHIVHVSTARSVKLVAEARAHGLDATCETCPHYLLLTTADMERLGAVAKCAPPLRNASELEQLWQALPQVSTLGSDHSPAPWKLKAKENFFEVWGGISSCQHLLPLLFDSEKITPNEIFRLTSESVATRFRLPAKSGITIGKDADLTLIDPVAEETITTESLHYRHRHSPYVGRTLHGRVVRTLLRGETIFENGRFAGVPSGKFLRPQKV
jgi:allantoinase